METKQTAADRIKSLSINSDGGVNITKATSRAAHSQPDPIRIRNRRLRYLQLHPEYFSSPHLERADPLLYDRLIRPFETAAERDARGQERTFAETLEVQLLRSEAKLAAVRQQHQQPSTEADASLVWRRNGDGSISGLERDEAERPQNREDGWTAWREVMEERFLRGEDGEIDYENCVDGLEELDDWEEENRGQLEGWLEDEDESFVGEGSPKGETGVQDF